MDKRAQTWGHFSPAHDADAARKFHKETAPVAGFFWDNGIKPHLRAPIAIAGAVGGGLAGAREADNTYGWRSLAHPWESLKMIGRGIGVGTKTGWNEAGRVYSDAAGAMVDAGNSLWLVPDSMKAKVDRWNDDKLLESIRRSGVPIPDNLPRDPDTGLLVPTWQRGYEDYDRFINWARGGRGVAAPAFAQAAIMGVGRAVGAGTAKLTGSERAGKVARRLTDVAVVPSVYGAGAAKDSYNALKEQRRQADRAVFEDDLERIRHMDPRSDEYRIAYEQIKKVRHLNPSAIDSLPLPVQAQDSSASSGWGRFAPGGWEGAVTGGLGGAGIGALLGLLFGGKGGLWKLGLLGALLGSAHGSGALGNIWNSLQNGWNGGSK